MSATAHSLAGNAMTGAPQEAAQRFGLELSTSGAVVILGTLASIVLGQWSMTLTFPWWVTTLTGVGFVVAIALTLVEMRAFLRVATVLAWQRRRARDRRA